MSSVEDKVRELASHLSERILRLGAKLQGGAGLDPTAIVGSCEMVAEAALQLAMMKFRSGDSAGYRDQLRTAAELFSQPLFSALAEWEATRSGGSSDFDTYGPIAISELWHSFAVFVLLDEWQAIERLAAHALSSESVIRTGRPMSDFAAAVFALMDTELMIIERSIASQESWPFEPEPLFLDLTLLARHIAKREQPEVNARMAKVDVAYKQRTKLKNSTSYGADFGVDRGYNELYFDYVTLVLAKIARRRGMSLPKMGRLEALLSDHP